MRDAEKPLTIVDKWLLRILSGAGAIAAIGLLAFIWHTLYHWIGDSVSLWTLPLGLAIASVTIVLLIPIAVIFIATFACTFEKET